MGFINQGLALSDPDVYPRYKQAATTMNTLSEFYHITLWCLSNLVSTQLIGAWLNPFPHCGLILVDGGCWSYMILFPEPIYFILLQHAQTWRAKASETAQQFMTAIFCFDQIFQVVRESHRHAERVKQGPETGHWHLFRSNQTWIGVGVTNVSWLMGKI